MTDLPIPVTRGSDRRFALHTKRDSRASIEQPEMDGSVLSLRKQRDTGQHLMPSRTLQVKSRDRSYGFGSRIGYHTEAMNDTPKQADF